MKAGPGIKKIAVVAVFIFLIVAAASGRIFAFSEVELEAVSFQTSDYEDSLQLNVSGYRIPHVSRLGMVNRIVIEFEDTVANPTIKNLLSGKRGCCVEKFEVQMFRKSAEVNDSGGVLQKLTNMNTLLVAYVESGVDVKVNVTGRMITLSFYRIEMVSAQSRPAPVNEIENVLFKKDELSEFLLVQTTGDNPPDIYEAADPRRLILTYSGSYTNPRVENQVFRYMETADLFSIEMFGLGSVPLPYLNMDQAGEYHFVGIPTPFANTSYEERIKGLQSNDVVITIFPMKDVDYRVTRRSGNIFELMFITTVHRQKPVCNLEHVHEDDSSPYDIQDEYERSIAFEDIAEK